MQLAEPPHGVQPRQAFASGSHAAQHGGFALVDQFKLRRHAHADVRMAKQILEAVGIYFIKPFTEQLGNGRRVGQL